MVMALVLALSLWQVHGGSPHCDRERFSKFSTSALLLQGGNP